ncbi:hypothetical protein [Yeosuana marina]|uniref:hypothetical protein n=1 Tax=Yeosuana marina TaxID=1565536 RepID=UPI00141DD0B7|nr:hypothetical protein [Yeosuana marina]
MNKNLLKSKAGYLFLLLLFNVCFFNAQTRSTKETKVVLIVSQKTNEISGLELFETQNSENTLPKKYPGNKFYLGILKGNYELDKNAVQPKSGAIITIYTDKQLFSEDQFSLKESINFGSIKTKVVSRNKGELILKTL